MKIFALIAITCLISVNLAALTSTAAADCSGGADTAAKNLLCKNAASPITSISTPYLCGVSATHGAANDGKCLASCTTSDTVGTATANTADCQTDYPTCVVELKGASANDVGLCKATCADDAACTGTGELGKCDARVATAKYCTTKCEVSSTLTTAAKWEDANHCPAAKPLCQVTGTTAWACHGKCPAQCLNNLGCDSTIFTTPTTAKTNACRTTCTNGLGIAPTTANPDDADTRSNGCQLAFPFCASNKCYAVNVDGCAKGFGFKADAVADNQYCYNECTNGKGKEDTANTGAFDNKCSAAKPHCASNTCYALGPACANNAVAKIVDKGKDTEYSWCDMKCTNGVYTDAETDKTGCVADFPVCDANTCYKSCTATDLTNCLDGLTCKTDGTDARCWTTCTDGPAAVECDAKTPVCLKNKCTCDKAATTPTCGDGFFCNDAGACEADPVPETEEEDDADSASILYGCTILFFVMGLLL